MDYRNFSELGPVYINTTNFTWWEENKTNTPAAIFGALRTLKNSQSTLASMRALHARLYGNARMMGALGISGSLTTFSQKQRMSYNIIQSAIDTLTSKISKNRPKPLFLTSGGKAKMQRKAKKLTQFVDGVYFSNEAYKLMSRCFRDAGVFGTSAIHDFDNFGSVGLERVPIEELWVDEIESLYNPPRNLYRVKTVDRNVLLHRFSKGHRAIKQANNAKPSDGESRQTSDLVEVVEAWHLPSSPKANDGRHCIVLEDTILYEEAWTRKTFPFAFFHYNERLRGFWGQGIAEQLQNVQLEINKLLWVIQRTMHLGGTAKLWLAQGSKVDTNHITNDILPIAWYTGQPPLYVTPPLVQPEIYAHLENLKRSGYEQVGISMLSATSKKPEGLDSGKALREYNDIESDRFMTTGQAYERFSLDIAYNVICRAKSIYEDKKELKVKVPGERFISTIDWEQVHMEEDEYIMQVFPVSAFSDDPSARLQDVQEYMQAGLIDKRTGKKLLNFPDIQMVETLDGSMEERILLYLDKIVDEGEYNAPDQYLDLELCKYLGIQYYNQYIESDLEPERLDQISTFIKEATSLQKLAELAVTPDPNQISNAPAPVDPSASSVVPVDPSAMSVGAPI